VGDVQRDPSSLVTETVRKTTFSLGNVITFIRTVDCAAEDFGKYNRLDLSASGLTNGVALLDRCRDVFAHRRQLARCRVSTCCSLGLHRTSLSTALGHLEGGDNRENKGSNATHDGSQTGATKRKDGHQSILRDLADK
jgi:hypothetical protein